MEKGQPALLYICPVLIFVNLGLASVRSELKEFWTFTMVRVTQIKQAMLFFLFINSIEKNIFFYVQKSSPVSSSHKNNEV